MNDAINLVQESFVQMASMRPVLIRDENGDQFFPSAEMICEAAAFRERLLRNLMEQHESQ